MVITSTQQASDNEGENDEGHEVKSTPLSRHTIECWLNRSALEWVIDQYQVRKDKRSGIVSDPNNLDDEEYIVHLIVKVIKESVETVNFVKELVQAVTHEDWLCVIKMST